MRALAIEPAARNVTVIVLVRLVIAPVGMIEVCAHGLNRRSHQDSFVAQLLLVVLPEHLAKDVESKLELVILAIGRGADAKAVLGVEVADDLLNRLRRDVMTLVNNDAI